MASEGQFVVSPDTPRSSNRGHHQLTGRNSLQSKLWGVRGNTVMVQMPSKFLVGKPIQRAVVPTKLCGL